MSHMYIKLLLERLFKDLFFRKPNVHYYDFQVCAYCLFMKHKMIVLKSSPTLLSLMANKKNIFKTYYQLLTLPTPLRQQQIKQTKNNHCIIT